MLKKLIVAMGIFAYVLRASVYGFRRGYVLKRMGHDQDTLVRMVTEETDKKYSPGIHKLITWAKP